MRRLRQLTEASWVIFPAENLLTNSAFAVFLARNYRKFMCIGGCFQVPNKTFLSRGD